jgi:hypothetical protein
MEGRKGFVILVAALWPVAACGGSSSGDDTGGGTASDTGTGADGGDGGGADAGTDGDGDADTDGDTDTGAGDLVQQLEALTAGCSAASTSRYATDEGEPATVDVCALAGAFFWKADMDVDCDGQETAECNLAADPWYQGETSFTQSDGQPLVASLLPYVVVPLPSARFDYQASGIEPGAACIVIYDGTLQYGVFGDEGPKAIIGEASYAMAASLGIDPDPSTGGADDGVTYIVFTGAGAAVSPIEDHQAAVDLGQQLAAHLLADN